MKGDLWAWSILLVVIALLSGTLPIEARENTSTAVQTMSSDSIDSLLGKEVMNPKGARLAHIGGVLLSGNRIAYLVLNIAEENGSWRCIPVPASLAVVRRSDNSVIVDLEKRTLSEAPAYPIQDRPDFADPEYNREIHSYYGESLPERDMDSYILIRR
ncbi:MAG: hypothetical protein C4576_26605 [Desulfobacteraceae bacterium]|nr:MAG: hypothetical protein C4576_26605 [Desulfobacteraceae bacterium]